MHESSYLHKSGSPREALVAALNQFGDTVSLAQAFGVQTSTAERWFRGGGRMPGADIRAEMQNYLPGQQRTVIVTGEMNDSGRDRRIEITLNRADNIEYSRMKAEGKEQAALVFLIAAEHGKNWKGAPALVGAEWYPEDEDFYDGDYEYDTDYVIV